MKKEYNNISEILINNGMKSKETPRHKNIKNIILNKLESTLQVKKKL